MKNEKKGNQNKFTPVSGNNWQIMCFSGIIFILLLSSGYLYVENKDLENQLVTVTHGAEILDAEVPDPVFKYSPLLINVDDPEIKERAMSLDGAPEIYYFVRDKIEYSRDYTKYRSAVDVLEKGKGDCLGQADLLAGLLLAHGYSPEDVDVNMGYVTRDGELWRHAWVEFNNSGTWLVLDSSRFLGTFEFSMWDKGLYYRTFLARPYAEFNNRYVHVNLDGTPIKI